MNSYFLTLFLRSIPKKNPNDFENNIIILKPKKEWKTDILIYSLLFVISVFAFIFLTDFKYIGVFFFMGGFAGAAVSLFFLLRAITIYKNYENIFTEENIKKCK